MLCAWIKSLNVVIDWYVHTCSHTVFTGAVKAHNHIQKQVVMSYVGRFKNIRTMKHTPSDKFRCYILVKVQNRDPVNSQNLRASSGCRDC